jgi:ParB family chromosome partitioning protein
MTRKIKYKAVSSDFNYMISPPGGHKRASVGLEQAVGEYFYISTEDLIPYKNQARQIFNEEDINQLAESIKMHGVRQPLTVVKSTIDPKKYEVVSGERRLRAAKLIGKEKVPCIILSEDAEADAIAIIENIHRQDLHPIECGKAYKKAIENGIFKSQTDLAQKIAVTESTVSESIKLAELPQDIQDHIIRHNITGRDKLRELIKASSAGKAMPSASIKNISVLRISSTSEGLRYQDKGLNKLSDLEKSELRAYLESILEKIVN